MKEVIGRCIGETSPTQVSFISKKMPRVGEYVSLEYDEKIVLGMIESLVRGSVSINDEIYDPDTVEKIKEIEGDDHYIRGTVRILGDIVQLRIPRTPPPPGTEVIVARAEVLEEIFRIPSGGLKIGELITQEGVEVEIDINKMVTRHLAILAMTGAGKSNTVAVIADGLLLNHGSVIIFDMHSEYSNTRFINGKVNKIKPTINPQYLSLSELAKLANITGDSYVQERYFRRAYLHAKELLKSGELPNKDFFQGMILALDTYLENEDYKSDRTSIISARAKTEYVAERYKDILNINAQAIVKQIKISSANVIDLGSVDEVGSDVIVSHALKHLLRSRKNYIKSGEGLNFPIFMILEEAHILAPKSRGTRSKYWISRIAREGRKFGAGLCLVSQSPKSLDPDSLSQANNMIILR
jgi:DNA helicase HerA-like ATPase